MSTTTTKTKTDAVKVKRTYVQKILSSPTQAIFHLLGFISFALIFPWSLTTYNYIQSLKNHKNKPDSYKFPDVSELGISVIVGFLFPILHHFSMKFFPQIFVNYAKDQHDIEKRDFRCQRAGKYLYKFLWTACIQAWVYSFVLDFKFFPKTLGGYGETAMEGFRGFPFKEKEPMVKQYFKVKLGYFFAEIVILLIEPKKYDFIEMGLHHLLTMYAHLGMYFGGLLEVPMVIDILHDWGDMFLQFAKMFSETNFSKILGVAFIINNFVWFYTRLYVFPMIIYEIMQDKIADDDQYMFHPFVKWFFIYSQCALFILHIYWFGLMMRGVIMSIKGKSPEDERNNKQDGKDSKKNK